jgi:hypothetical protein
MTDKLERVSRMIDGTGEYDGVLLKAEIERMERPSKIGGIAADYVPGGADRLAAMKRRLKLGPPDPEIVESNYQRRIRQELEREAEEQFDAETQEAPATDLAGILEQRSKLLKQIDAALAKLVEHVAAEAALRDQALQLMHGFPTDLRDRLNGQEVIGAILSKLGEGGILPDRRFDRSEPVPDLAGLAKCHDLIRTHTKGKAA